MMTWNSRANELFLKALELCSEGERKAYLERVCAGDEAVRAEAEALLAASAQAGPFLESPVSAAPLVPTVDEPLPERPGTVIGPYKLMEQIGEGGMGLVFVAEQQHPVRRKVALKVIKPGQDTKEVIARFEAERQALALMDHPNIARVLDAGATASGQPYFVMELVKGTPITQFCDDHRLTPRQRLELFLSVCQAVQHAHQKGIIHRDVKPSNVLVSSHDGTPVVKVIDFGVAKAVGQQLTEKTLYTGFAQMIGTPLYMSPEQAGLSDLDVDTRTDLYALGVLLYELLTGTTPFEGARLRQAGYDEIRRIIREEEPPKPSTRISTLGQAASTVSGNRQSDPKQLGQLMRGELDWIVMKALEKDRNRRYETANAFAADVQRYLHDEPVQACPPTAGYRLHKFARKHQRLLASVAACAALLLLGVAGSTWQALRATQAESLALAERDEKEQARQAEVEQRAAAVQSEQVAQEERVKAQRQRDEAQRQRDEVQALNEQLRATQDKLRSRTYAAEINLAQHAFEAGVSRRTRDLLEKHRPRVGETDLRGFEWNYLDRLCHQDLLTLKGHTSGITIVVYSPDGKRLASASSDQTVKVWDAQTGQELLSFKRHTGVVLSLAFSPDGKRLASGGPATDGPYEVKVWDAQTGQEFFTLKDVARYPAFSPDGKRLAGGNRRMGKVWDAQTGQELLTFSGESNQVTFSPDGKRLATAADSTLKVRDAQTGQELFGCKGHSANIIRLAFSPDGKRLASASWDKTAKVWDAQTGEDLLTLKGHSDYVWSVSFSPDGKRLATGGDKTVKVWDAQTGLELHTFKGHWAEVRTVAFSPDGERLASADGVEVKVWDAHTDRKAFTLRGRGPTDVASVAFSPGGKHLATGRVGSGNGPGEVQVWDAQTGRELFTLQAYIRGVRSVAFSPEGRRLATGNSFPGSPGPGEVQVWDAQTGQEFFTVKGGGLCVAFSPYGKHLASASSGSPQVGRVTVWDAQTGKDLFTLKGSGSCVAFSPDGKRLASASTGWGPQQGVVKVWDAQTGQELVSCTGHGHGINEVVFSPDGHRLASASWDNTVKVWDAHTGQELLTLIGHAGMVGSVAFSPDGKRLASASRGPGKWDVKVWEAQTGQELLIFEGPGGYDASYRGLAFSPNGHQLVSGSADGTVMIWDATPLPEKP
jgi:WD40 repeat protein/serine/threonine protein kinase